MTDFLKKKGGLFLLMLVFPLLVLSLIFEILFLCLNQSPIGLVVARKK